MGSLIIIRDSKRSEDESQEDDNHGPSLVSQDNFVITQTIEKKSSRLRIKSADPYSRNTQLKSKTINVERDSISL